MTPDIPLVFAHKRLTHETLTRLAEAGYYYCLRCEQVKPLSEFQAKHSSKNGVRSPCKACQQVYEKARNAAPERHSQWRAHKKPSGYVAPKEQQRRKVRRAHRRAIELKKNAHRGLYVLQMGDLFKIGKSADLQKRLPVLRSALPFASQLIHTIQVADDLGVAERALHQRFANRRLNGEWFALTSDDLETLTAISDM